jgi:hypothetical protein
MLKLVAHFNFNSSINIYLLAVRLSFYFLRIYTFSTANWDSECQKYELGLPIL